MYGSNIGTVDGESGCWTTTEKCEDKNSPINPQTLLNTEPVDELLVSGVEVVGAQTDRGSTKDPVFLIIQRHCTCSSMCDLHFRGNLNYILMTWTHAKALCWLEHCNITSGALFPHTQIKPGA